jgi:GNAT superfamily N-acetyltransferase
MIIEISKHTDLNKLAECHKKAFPHSLSSQMGNLFIKKMLSWYIVSERGILFHIIENNDIIGYCGGIIIKKAGLPGAATSITQHCFKTFIFSFILRPWLIFHSENIKRFSFIKRNLMYKLGLKKLIVNETKKPIIPFSSSWGLVVIGVKPKYQGKGAGSVLLQEFEKLAKKDGVQKNSLSVMSTNIQAIKAYEKNGWIKGSQNDESLNMYKEL